MEQRKETLGQVLTEAEELFARYDRLRAEMAHLDLEIRQMCLRYGEAAGQWGTRPEHIRNTLKLRVAA